VAFALFALLHSVGAREPFKNALARWTGRFFVEHFWRLVKIFGQDYRHYQARVGAFFPRFWRQPSA
jgi:protein-S-isoprenylcysteine O-methyltransferase Ste14